MFYFAFFFPYYGIFLGNIWFPGPLMSCVSRQKESEAAWYRKGSAVLECVRSVIDWGSRFVDAGSYLSLSFLICALQALSPDQREILSSQFNQSKPGESIFIYLVWALAPLQSIQNYAEFWPNRCWFPSQHHLKLYEKCHFLTSKFFPHFRSPPPTHSWL